MYWMTRSREAIRVADNRAGEIKPQPAIFPAYTAPVARKADDGERKLVPMSWGLVLLQPGKAPRRVTNVRDFVALRPARCGFCHASKEFIPGLR